MKKLLFLVLLFFTISKSYCCSCATKPSVKMDWENANEVFIGKIIKVDSMHFGNNGAKIYSYTVEVVKSFKQEFHETRTLRTIISQDSASCDFMFEVGEDYLIYAKSDSRTLATSLCSRTNIIKFIEESEFQELEKLYKEYASDTNEMREMGDNNSYQVELVKKEVEKRLDNQRLIIYGLSGIIVLLLVMVLIMRKRKD